MGGSSHRGVSEVVGFVLVFGMVMTAFTVYQGVAVPAQNRHAEVEHSFGVRADLTELRNAVLRTAATGGVQGVTVELAPTYPPGVVTPRADPSGGTIDTVESTGGIRVDNVRATDEETRDHVDGSLGPVRSTAVRYSPTYAYYGGAPVTIFENSLVYARFHDSDVVVTDQAVIEGRRITLVAVEGNLSSAGRGTAAITTSPVSATERRIAVRNTTGDRIHLTLPTRLAAATWLEVLGDELVGNGGHVEAVLPVQGEQAVRIVLEPGITYELAMGVVGLGHGSTDTPPAYVTAVEGDGGHVRAGASLTLAVEVRDRFNNPVSGAVVSATPPSAGTVSPIGEPTTGPAGRARFVYAAPDDVAGSRDVEVVLGIGGPSEPARSVALSVRVLAPAGASG